MLVEQGTGEGPFGPRFTQDVISFRAQHVVPLIRRARNGESSIRARRAAEQQEAGPGQPGRREESSSVIHAHHLARGLVGSSNNEKLLAGR